MANVDDYSGSARLLAATTRRNVLGKRNLGDILAYTKSIAQEMQAGFYWFSKEYLILCYKTFLEEATGSWGVQIERVELKDVRVPENLQRAMAALKHATEVIIDSPAALQFLSVIAYSLSYLIIFQLRYLQTMNSIAAENNSTLLFPVPIDIISNMLNMASPGKLTK